MSLYLLYNFSLFRLCCRTVEPQNMFERRLSIRNTYISAYRKERGESELVAQHKNHAR